MLPGTCVSACCNWGAEVCCGAVCGHQQQHQHSPTTRQPHGSRHAWAPLQVAVQKSAAALYAATIDNKIAMKVGAADWSPIAGNVQVCHSSWPLSVGLVRGGRKSWL